jgi:hypothetical protein
MWREQWVPAAHIIAPRARASRRPPLWQWASLNFRGRPGADGRLKKENSKSGQSNEQILLKSYRNLRKRSMLFLFVQSNH